MPVLETARLTLRPFGKEDLDLLAELMANPDFMRFSLGPKTHRQTAAFLETVIGWYRAGLPSPFAVVIRSDGVLVGYCGFLHQEVDGEKEIEIGYRLHPDYWNRGIATEAARKVRDHAFSDLELPRVISLHSLRQHFIAARRRKDRDDFRKGNSLQRFSDSSVRPDSRAVAHEVCRRINSPARARYAVAPAPLGSYSRIDLAKLGA